jgi:hypothetical protein
MMLYTSVLHPPAPQQLLALVSLSCKAISAYLARTISFVSFGVVMGVGGAVERGIPRRYAQQQLLSMGLYLSNMALKADRTLAQVLASMQ